MCQPVDLVFKYHNLTGVKDAQLLRFQTKTSELHQAGMIWFEPELFLELSSVQLQIKLR